MTLVDKTVDETINKHNWDFYRDNYLAGRYSFSDLIELNNRWRESIPEQVFFHYNWIKDFLLKIKIENPVVVELGCWEGNLAEAIFKDTDLKMNNWCGYDICSLAVAKGNERNKNKRYCAYPLVCQLWKTNIAEFDIFISCHTVEHLSRNEFLELLDWLKNSSCTYAYFEVPIPEKGKVWRNGGSAHVLNNFGRRHFRRYLEQDGWHKMVEFETRGLDWAIGVGR